MDQQATLQGDQPPAFELGKFWLPGLAALSVIVLALIAGFTIGKRDKRDYRYLNSLRGH